MSLLFLSSFSFLLNSTRIRCYIKTELGKLIKAGIEILNDRPDREGYQNMLADFYVGFYSRKQVKRYQERHPEESKRYGAKSIVAKKLRVLRFISYLLCTN